MRPHHLVAGACAAALFGAVTGTTITTHPLDRGSDAWDHIAGLNTDWTAKRLNEPEALPDHYPLTTPEGRFEVGELRDRGLYRNRRFAMHSYWDDDPDWGDYAEPAYELAAADYRYLPPEDDEPVAVQTAAAARAAARAALEKVQQEERPEVLAAAAADEPLDPPPLARPAPLAGAPRAIDVSAELAERR